MRWYERSEFRHYGGRRVQVVAFVVAIDGFHPNSKSTLASTCLVRNVSVIARSRQLLQPQEGASSYTYRTPYTRQSRNIYITSISQHKDVAAAIHKQILKKGERGAKGRQGAGPGEMDR